MEEIDAHIEQTYRILHKQTSTYAREKSGIEQTKAHIGMDKLDGLDVEAMSGGGGKARVKPAGTRKEEMT